VRDHGDGCTEQCCQQLLGGSELRGGPVRDQGSDGDADEGVEGAPDQIEGGDLAGEEFDGEEGRAGGDYGPAFEEFQGWREWKMSKRARRPRAATVA